MTEAEWLVSFNPEAMLEHLGVGVPRGWYRFAPSEQPRGAAKAYDGSARARALTPGQRMGRKAHPDALSLR
jgi:hypothetical protein